VGAYVVPDFVSPECRDLVGRMLVGDPEKRATLEEVQRHPWLQAGHFPLSGDLEEDPFTYTLPHEVDPEIVEQMEILGFPREQALDAIVNNRYDVAASTYYLLFSRKHRSRPPAQAPSAETTAPAAQRPSRGTRGHKRHHTMDVPIAEMDDAPLDPHPDPLRDPAPQISAAKQETAPPAPPPPTITLTPSTSEQKNVMTKEMYAATNGNPGLLPFLRQRGHHRSRSVDTTSTRVVGSAQHDYTSHIIKEATILNSSPAARAPRRSPPFNKNYPHSSGAQHSPTSSSPHHSPHEIARAQTASSRRSATLRPSSDQQAALAIPEATRTSQNPVTRLQLRASVQFTPPSQDQGANRPGHRRAQSYDIRAHNQMGPQEPPSAPQWNNGAEDDEEGLLAEGNKVGDQSKNGGPLNSFVHSIKSSLGLLRNSGGRGEREKEPRSIRFALNVSTTSAKLAAEIMHEVCRVLSQNNISFTTSAYCAYCTCDDVHFEIEVCKLPMLSMNGIRFNRISGDAWTYKRIAAKLIEEMEL